MSSDRSASAVKNYPANTKPVRARRQGEPQREQKEATRKKLLGAARAVFEEWPYNAVSVDMIADQAGVSRTTYYRHFEGKLPIAMALFSDMLTHIQRRWKDILANPDPSLEQVEEWLGGQVQIVEADPVFNRVLRQVEAIEPDVLLHRLRYYETLMSIMWPENHRPKTRSMAELRAKSILLLRQMDQFLYLFGSREMELDRDATIKAMAELFHDFLVLRKREIAA